MAYTKTLRRNVGGLFVLAALLVFCGCTEVPKFCPTCGEDGNNGSTTYKVNVTGGVVVDGNGEYAAGEKVEIRAEAAPDGKKFHEWMSDDSNVIFKNKNSGSTYFFMPRGAVAVAANFVDKNTDIDSDRYEVKVENGVGEGSYKVGSTVSIKADSASLGYKFKIWIVTDGGDKVVIEDHASASATFTMPENDVTVEATFEEIHYTITFDAGAGGSVSTGTAITNKWVLAELPTPTLNNGYDKFDGWFTERTNGKQVVEGSTQFFADDTIYARYTAINYEIKYVSDVDGIVTHDNPLNYTVAILPIKLQSPLYSGDGDYTFVCWIDNNNNCIDEIPLNTTGPLEFKSAWQDKTVPASPCSLTVMNNFEDGTNFQVSSDKVECGYSNDITASSADSYNFVRWTTSGTGSGTLYTPESLSATIIVMNGHVTVTANFSPNVGGGTINIDTGLVEGQDGTNYKWVRIGGKKWMAENLNEWPSGQSAGIKCYKDTTDNCRKYGALYTWAAAQTVCPNGWKLPSRDDWGNLAKAVGGTGDYGEEGNAGLYLKSTDGWSDNGNGQNTYKFKALPGGYMFYNDTYDYAGSKGVWWTATHATNNDYYLRGMSYEHNKVSETTIDRNYGLSVRCVSDE